MREAHFPTKTIATVMALILAQWMLARHLATVDPLVAATRGHVNVTVALLGLLLTIRLALVFLVPGWVVAKASRWLFPR